MLVCVIRFSPLPPGENCYLATGGSNPSVDHVYGGLARRGVEVTWDQMAEKGNNTGHRAHTASAALPRLDGIWCR